MFQRRSTKTFKNQYGGFCGWHKIYNTLNTITDFYTWWLFAIAFKTGARAMEIPSLKRGMISTTQFEGQVYIHGMKVEKQKERVLLVDSQGDPLFKEDGKREFRFQSKEGFRNFLFPAWEPLSKEFVEFVDKNENDNDVLIPMSYNQMYYRMCKVGVPQVGFGGNGWNTRKGEFWLHRLRSERACQLVVDYSYDVFRLQRFFGWSSPDMPFEYIQMNPKDLIVTKPPAKWA
jgi:hypothetical protein